MLDGVTADGTRHVLWRVDDAEAIGRVRRVMSPLVIYIADGHHRYETMLALRDRLRERAGGEIEPRASAEFATMFLCNMDDPGLVQETNAGNCDRAGQDPAPSARRCPGWIPPGARTSAAPSGPAPPESPEACDSK